MTSSDRYEALSDEVADKHRAFVDYVHDGFAGGLELDGDEVDRLLREVQDADKRLADYVKAHRDEFRRP